MKGDCKSKLLSGWKYALYYRDMIALNSESDPRLIEKMINVLVEEGVARRLIRKLPLEFGLLDFEARTDSLSDPQSVIISVCTSFRKDKCRGSMTMKELFKIPLKKEQRSEQFHLTESTSWKITEGDRIVGDLLAQ